MELEEMKNEWRRLDGRLESMEKRLDRMTLGITSGTFRSSFDRLRWRFRLCILLAVLLPVNFWAGFCRPDSGPEMMWLLGGTCLFAVLALLQHVRLLDCLSRIDLAGQNLREACAAVIRLRRLFLRGVATRIPLAVLWLAWLGAVLWRGGNTYILYGFVMGLLVGLPLGLSVFLRIRREIDTLQHALEEAEA